MIWECNTVLMSKIRNDRLRDYDPARAEHETLDQVLTRHIQTERTRYVPESERLTASEVIEIRRSMGESDFMRETMRRMSQELARHVDQLILQALVYGTGGIEVSPSGIRMVDIVDARRIMDAASG